MLILLHIDSSLLGNASFSRHLSDEFVAQRRKIHSADGVSAVNHGAVDRDTFLHPHLQAVRERFQAV